MAYSDRGRVALPFGSNLTFHLYTTEDDKVGDLLNPSYFRGVVGRRGFMPGDWLFVQAVDGFAIFAVRSVNLDTTVVLEQLSSSVQQPTASVTKLTASKKD